MAFFAELCRKQWYCVCGENWIRYYRKFRYDIWYESLTEEQKEQVQIAEIKKRKEDEYELYTALAEIFILNKIVLSLY